MRVDTGRLRVVGSDALEPAQAEDGAPPSPGAYLREHRERRGLSLEELAEATKVPRDSLELIEADRFSELPGTVFAKGFLRCCARVLSLDEATVLGLFYERERYDQRSESRSGRGRRESSEALVVPASRVRAPERRRGREPSGAWVAGASTRLGEAPSENEESPAATNESGPQVGLKEASRQPSGPQREAEASMVARAAASMVSSVGEGARSLGALIKQRWIGPRGITGPRILLWFLVALFVVLVVYLAFTLASGQQSGGARL